MENKNEFLSLDSTTRKRIIHRVINVNSLKTPRLKSWKEHDQEDYERGRKINPAYQPCLFSIILKEEITNAVKF